MDVGKMADNSSRVLPTLTEENFAFWTGGEKGLLQINQCGSCHQYIHPPSPMCSKCHSREVSANAVSGKGKVASYSINYTQWQPDLEVPYAVVIIELDEQAGLFITSQLINCSLEDLHIGMPVKVRFEQYEDIYLPFFEPK